MQSNSLEPARLKPQPQFSRSGACVRAFLAAAVVGVSPNKHNSTSPPTFLRLLCAYRHNLLPITAWPAQQAVQQQRQRRTQCAAARVSIVRSSSNGVVACSSNTVHHASASSSSRTMSAPYSSSMSGSSLLVSTKQQQQQGGRVHLSQALSSSKSEPSSMQTSYDETSATSTPAAPSAALAAAAGDDYGYMQVCVAAVGAVLRCAFSLQAAERKRQIGCCAHTCCLL